MSNPLISVIIPVFNGENYLATAKKVCCDKLSPPPKPAVKLPRFTRIIRVISRQRASARDLSAWLAEKDAVGY